jgi:hypothetical protein
VKPVGVGHGALHAEGHVNVELVLGEAVITVVFILNQSPTQSI